MMDLKRKMYWLLAPASALALALACGEAGKLPMDPAGAFAPVRPNFAIAQVGTPSLANTTENKASSLSLSVPAGASVGDFLIAQIVVEGINTDDLICKPNGWVEVNRTNNSSSTAQAIFYKFKAVADVEPHVWTFKASGNTCASAGGGKEFLAVGGMLAYSGIDPTTPILGFGSDGGSGNSFTTRDAPNVTGPFPAGTKSLRFFGNNKEFAIGTSAGVIYNSQVPKGGGGFEKPTGAAAITTQAALGPTGSLTGTNGNNSANWVTHTIVLGEAAPPPPSNRPPVISGVEDEYNICELVPFSFTAAASDPDGDAVTLSIVGGDAALPDGASFDPSTGEFNWTPAEDQDPGPYTFKIKATDDGTPQESVEHEVTINVAEANTAPVLDPIGNKEVYLGDLLQFTATASDGDLVNGIPNTLTFSLAGTVPAGASITSAGVFTWTPGPGQAGLHNITIRVTDNGPDTDCGDADLYDEETITVNVRLRTYFLALDEEAITKGKAPNNFTDSHINESITRIGQRAQLAYFAANVGKSIQLPSGQVGDEGWFAIKTHPNSWVTAGPTTNGFRNLLLAGPGLGGGSNREAYLDKIANVTPLRATGLRLLIGHQVCAIVWKSDVSINYGPLNGSLKGDNRGIVAFEVTAVTRSGSGSTLPRVTLTIRNAAEVCAEPLLPLSAAPAPTSSSSPMDVVP